MAVDAGIFLGTGTWQERLDYAIATMRELSLQTEPQAMVRNYGNRLRQIFPIDRSVSLSRRNLQRPQVRITRYTHWEHHPNPWKDVNRLPVFDRGLFSELIWGNEPIIIDDLELSKDDPAAAFLTGHRSLAAIPLFNQGVAVNMVLVVREEPASFDREVFPELVWISNLFGMATHNLVLADEVRTAYELVDRELTAVADIQHSLLPAKLPDIPGMQIAVHYETSRRAGGDYYDFFPLPDGRWGMLIADVSGHGTPAAVMMAVAHSLAHSYSGPADKPSQMLEYLNQRLVNEYTSDNGTFITAFYAVYDPRTRSLTYSSAGHDPPRIRRCGEGSVHTLDGTQRYPLGVVPDPGYVDETKMLHPGDRMLFFTDGIIEAANSRQQLFGKARVDELLGCCRAEPSEIVADILTALKDFTGGGPAQDDRTLLAVRVV